MFQDYLKREEILFRLCKARAKLARHRGKSHLNHIISADKKYNYHYNNPDSKRHKGDDIDLLCSIMPPRRKWINPTKKERYPRGTIQRINSVEYNTKALLKTISFYETNNPSEPFLINLNQFIDEILKEVNSGLINLTTPHIQPKLKKPEKKTDMTCRPICIFSLKDKIIISIVNKYLTEALDQFFYEHSYAFRSKRDGGKFPPTHHTAIKYLLEYKSKYKGKNLWVAECDISKFFDTVNHQVVKKAFYDLVKKHNRIYRNKIDKLAIKVFEKYLKCYDFQKMVYSQNSNLQYWIDNRKEGGEFEWVEKDLENLGCYKQIIRNKIGIPQGGALSGLIANIVLHSIDEKIVNDNDDKLCYIRFCDDMLLIHPNRKICEEKSNLYFEGLKELKLVFHSPTAVSPLDKYEFWNKSKSKSPYKWSNESSGSFKRIGFVGYEICFNGTLRVRKSSLIKEKRKISTLVRSTLDILKNGKRKSDDMILESVSNKLIGMSVGRVTMKNYKISDNEMCWTNGFTLLQNNKILRLQLRKLDHYRSRKLAFFARKLEKISSSTSQKHTETKKIGRHFFTKISGISYEDSEKIRIELQALKVLNVKFFLTKSKKELLKNSPQVLQLSSQYLSHLVEIHSLLLNDSQENRYVPYYGKPFSYYYNIIEKVKT
ncbi:reverse transcriptase/maturase family protein [Chryseobacterium arthrosphaerae]|uniref:reverse transcriptase/maturase family protein n=1 Tax=Chryseobacterium arthrosphaerae TaxID=651561 RepID=UPI0023E10959|nr:reverse transcriptase/maturase family protein [Chryseobacterium arthrosphaerae]WES99881.1 reverse transcriptase/maturase family protein [Chryseobacterium arthrosphaerae]